MDETTSSKGILWLKLDEPSKTKLMSRFPPSDDNAYYHHVTLLFGIPKASVLDHIGQIAVIQAHAYAKNDDTEAVRVNTDLPDTYGVPHITLSTGKGIAPFASVAMLQDENHYEAPITPPIELSGEIEFIPLHSDTAA